MGQGTIFCTPQEFSLGHLTPGRHQLTIAVDNTRLPVQSEAHQWSDNTQTNWNGIIGRIELQATDPVWIDDLQAYPNAAKHLVLVKLKIAGERSAVGTVNIHVAAAGMTPYDASISFSSAPSSPELDLPLASARTWDEFHPNLITLTANLRAGDYSDARTITFGLRDFSSSGKQFTINGRTTFLRGKHNACVFPLTGYPPMDVAGWVKYLRACQDFGINQIRCHTFVPPDAAFTAADQLGIYMQPELPFWGDFNDGVKQALEPEAIRILKCYGNHPSFVMFTMGNENRGSRAVIASLVDELRTADPRHLYAQGSNAFLWDPILPPGDDFLISARAKANESAPSLPVRGSFADLDAHDGHVQYGPPNTMTDYSASIASIPRPVVGHEVGQYTVYPDFREIAKYTGVTRAMNLEHFRDRLKSTPMFDQADDFFRASARWPKSATARRSNRRCGRQTSGDSSSSTSRISRGRARLSLESSTPSWTPRESSRRSNGGNSAPPSSCSAGSRNTSGQRMNLSRLKSSSPIMAKKIWPARSSTGKSRPNPAAPIASGKLPPIDLPQGGLRNVGSVTIPLSTLPSPARYSLNLSLENTAIQTSYPLWIYPPSVDLTAPPNVTIARSLTRAAFSSLAAGGNVLLIADGSRPLVHSVGGGFATDFWCWPMFHNKPGTMGLLCDPSNPALKHFPTEFHSNWQWFDIALHSQPVILNDLPADFRPDVQVIDNMERVDRLGLVFGLRVGPGKLLVCASDILSMQSDPAARQLLRSLLQYTASPDFSPTASMAPDQLQELLMSHIPMLGKATASSFDPGWQNYKPPQAADGNEYTQWNAADQSLPQWWQFTFDKPQDLSGIEILWGEEKAGYGYTVQISANDTDWKQVCDETKNSYPTGRHRLQLSASGVRSVRVVITAVLANTRAGIRELWLF